MKVRGLLKRPELEQRYSLDQLITDATTFGFNGNTYGVGFSWASHSRTAELPVGMGSFVSALLGCPPAFAAQLVRGELMAQVDLVVKGRRGTPEAGKVVAEVDPMLYDFVLSGGLERMEWHAGPAGAAYVHRSSSGLRLLQPDRLTVLLGSNRHPKDPRFALDAAVAGYWYQEAEGHYVTLLPDEVAQWCPIPDPQSPWRGLSWLTPVLRETQGDRLATEHKLKFFENAGTPNLVFSLDKTVTPEQLKEFKQATDEVTAGVKNAYKNLYLGGGADVTVVGADLKQLDFAATQATGENRIAVASRVPAAILGIKEGLQGSTLNAGNFGQARRAMADTWLFSNLRSMCATLDRLVPSGPGRMLGYDHNLPFLREDAKDAAEILRMNADTVRTLTDAGYTPETVKAAVLAGDFDLLEHSGYYSVQLQELGVTPPAA